MRLLPAPTTRRCCVPPNTCGKLNAMDPMTGHLVMDRWDEVYNGVVVTEL